MTTATIRTLTIGTEQLTIAMARQLDRITYLTHRAAAITPMGRIRSGADVEIVEALPGRPAKPDRDRHVTITADTNPARICWWQIRHAAAWLEVIGTTEDGTLVVFVVDSRKAMTDWLSGDDEEIAAIEAFTRLPLIVLGDTAA